MDEAGEAGPLVFRKRIREGEVPFEVLVLFGDLVEVVDVEGLARAARAVPERHLAVGVDAAELIEDVRAHGRHDTKSR